MGIEELLAGRLFQIAFVVDDLDEALRRYTAVLGGEPWRCYMFSAAIHRTCEYRGAPRDFTARLALNDGSPQIELIEPVRGPSIHRDWLEERGEGVHHVGVVVESVQAATTRMEEAGYDAIQSGTGFGADGDGAYAYFDTRRDLGVVVEAVEPPGRMPDPEFVWP
jgi:catechol 2,3-dioxygenase-like lactoylglutathione lyase family enzyme